MFGNVTILQIFTTLNVQYYEVAMWPDTANVLVTLVTMTQTLTSRGHNDICWSILQIATMHITERYLVWTNFYNKHFIVKFIVYILTKQNLWIS